jgi:hypothetical protein
VDTSKPPETLTHLEMVMIDIGNAYLYAECSEKYYATASKEFGEIAGRVVVIVRALCGPKSAGASWNHHLVKEHMDGVFPCKADPDVWLR